MVGTCRARMLAVVVVLWTTPSSTLWTMVASTPRRTMATGLLGSCATTSRRRGQSFALVTEPLLVCVPLSDADCCINTPHKHQLLLSLLCWSPHTACGVGFCTRRERTFAAYNVNCIPHLHQASCLSQCPVMLHTIPLPCTSSNWTYACLV